MKRTSLLFHSLVLLFLLTLASCGSDNALTGKPSSTSNSISLGAECSCDSSYSPVCGVNTSGNEVSYDNKCIAGCYKATRLVGGNCVCSESLRVCGVDNRDYTECEARMYRIVVKKYGSCSGTNYH